MKTKFKRALNIVRRFFPQVENVEDATIPLTIEVTQSDSNNAKLKNHSGCAFAMACKRAQKADGVIVSIKTCYVVRGNRAVRYRFNESVSREVVSFDRKGGFDPGLYAMRPPAHGERLGEIRTGRDTGERGNGKRPTKFRHKTGGIRTSLSR